MMNWLFLKKKKKKEEGRKKKKEGRKKEKIEVRVFWHSADIQLTFNEKFQCNKRNGNSSSKIHLPLKLSANNKSGHFANGDMG